MLSLLLLLHIIIVIIIVIIICIHAYYTYTYIVRGHEGAHVRGPQVQEGACAVQGRAESQ